MHQSNPDKTVMTVYDTAVFGALPNEVIREYEWDIARDALADLPAGGIAALQPAPAREGE